MGARAQKRERPQGRTLDRQLDEALGQTFPASDPFSVGQITANEPPSRPIDRNAPLVTAEARTSVRRRGSKRAA
jgi:hypothetical protein